MTVDTKVLSDASWSVEEFKAIARARKEEKRMETENMKKKLGFFVGAPFTGYRNSSWTPGVRRR